MDRIEEFIQAVNQFPVYAEFKKFTASLLTPTIRSPMARIAKAIIIIRYMSILSVNVVKISE